MSKSPEEYFREQSLVPASAEKGGAFSETELAFMRKYMGLDTTDMLHRIGIETRLEEPPAPPPSSPPAEEEAFAPKSGKLVPPGLEQLAPTAEAQQVMTKFVAALEAEPAPPPAGPGSEGGPEAGAEAPAEQPGAPPQKDAQPPLAEEVPLSAPAPEAEPEAEDEEEPGLSRAAQALVEAASALTEAASAWAGVAEKGAAARLQAEETPVAPPEVAAVAPSRSSPAEPLEEHGEAEAAPPEEAAPAPAPLPVSDPVPAAPKAAPAPAAPGKLESLRPLTAQEEDLHAEMAEERDLESIMRAEAELQMVGFYLGAQEFTVPIIAVQEVIRYQEPAKLPASPEFVAGVINLRGKMTPLVYLRDMLEIRQERKTDDRFIIVCRRKGLQFGLIIERVHTMYRVPQRDIDWGIEAHLGINVDLISGLLKLDESLVAIVSVDRVVDYVLER
jgi:purine-binding chemotaxis protein CheW